MRELRVVIVIPGFPTEREEPGLAAVVDLVERIAQQHLVDVVALRHPPSRRGFVLAGARVHPLGIGDVGGVTGRTRVVARAVRAVTSLHRRRPVDIVHGLWADEAGAAAAIAARLIQRPSVVSVMGGELVAIRDIGYGAGLGRGGRWTVREALRRADLITAGSSYLRDQVLVHRADAPVILAPLGVDTTLFRPADSPAPRPTVLFAGSLEPVKDPAAALRAFAELTPARPGLRMVVVGSGSLRYELGRLVEELGVADRVELLGHVRRERMPDVYRAASVLCVTSRHEAQSMVAVEAAACGVPVVGTPVGVLPDLGGGARTVPLAHPPQLAAELGAVLDDSADAARMSAAAREAVLSQFDIERTSTQLLDRYEELVSSRGAPPGT